MPSPVSVQVAVDFDEISGRGLVEAQAEAQRPVGAGAFRAHADLAGQPGLLFRHRQDAAGMRHGLLDAAGTARRCCCISCVARWSKYDFSLRAAGFMRGVSVLWFCVGAACAQPDPIVEGRRRQPCTSAHSSYAGAPPRSSPASCSTRLRNSLSKGVRGLPACVTATTRRRSAAGPPAACAGRSRPAACPECGRAGCSRPHPRTPA